MIKSKFLCKKILTHISSVGKVKFTYTSKIKTFGVCSYGDFMSKVRIKLLQLLMFHSNFL